MAKPKAKPVKPELHTWSVNIDGQLNTIEAEVCMVHQAGVEFIKDDVLNRAVAHGHWSTIELVEPDQD